MTTIDELISGYTDEPGYFDFAKWGPISRPVVEEERALVDVQARARFGSEVALTEQAGRVRRAVSAVVGFPADQVVFQPDTSSGLVHTLFGLTGQVLMSPRDYPSGPVAATRAAAAMRVLEPVWMDLDHDVVTPAVVQRHLTDRVTAVAVSLVDYRTGYLVDLEGIRQVIGDRLLIVDAIQGFGVVDAPYGVADVIASGGQKWVRAGWGTGFLALSERASATLTPVFSGVAGTELRLGGSYHETLPTLPGAAAFQITNSDPIAQARFSTALEGIASVGVAAISREIADRASRLIDIADEFALPVVSPRDEAERAGIVVLEPSPEQMTTLTAALLNHGVTATVRDTTVRLSVHLSTDDDSFDLLRGALTSFGTTVYY
ncbi:aminotransferase class V-fold PLP-dependent enzyme [Frigoribacterium sp. CFBP9030]|uniref:aminotransferase class V-fold PLP-dependent enzyme n=1 Tax=Frigoribacterium sp. CFBP9030 TaxID=3096537 RepID=UPI002A6B76BC|nr:aminotransferase class V-fold PLP-dependent enzyme [Frigoribacterium sp. CFBP9030]MDY0890433.1 aminotransferase class V-fold PLP-dependent enzyme [Frigoribacterium sp. CFBP9030]